MELKLSQELVSVDQDPVYLVFLDLRKAYYNLDSGRILKTLEEYEEGPKMQGLLAKFWLRREVVHSQNRYHGTQFQAT